MVAWPLAVVLIAATPFAALAQSISTDTASYPSRPVRFIV